VLPYPKRKNERILVIADKALEEHATAHKLPYVVTFEAVQGTSKEKWSMKRELAKNHHSFISVATFNKAFEMRIIAAKRKPIYCIKNPAELKTFYEEITRTVKFKLRKTCDISFPVGYLEMPADQIIENIEVGLSFLVSLLKKGEQSISSLHLKSSKSKAVRIY
jgi:large subunit ribosomal protein L10Ae